jgi:zinc protease
MRNALLAILAGTLAAGCKPLPFRMEFSPVHFEVSDSVLPSGLRVQVEHDASVQQVAIALVVGAGSADDPKGKEGLAHLAEHLVFRARHVGQMSSGALAPLMGASVDNAYTNLDDTVFFMSGPTEADLDSEGDLLLAVQPQALDHRWQECRAASTVGMIGDASLARAAWQKNGW